MKKITWFNCLFYLPELLQTLEEYIRGIWAREDHRIEHVDDVINKLDIIDSKFSTLSDLVNARDKENKEAIAILTEDCVRIDKKLIFDNEYYEKSISGIKKELFDGFDFTDDDDHKVSLNETIGCLHLRIARLEDIPSISKVIFSCKKTKKCKK